MTQLQLMMLALKLQVQSHVTVINLSGHDMGDDMMRALAAPIAQHTSLRALYLASACNLPCA